MPTGELTLNEQVLDLHPNTVIAITLAVADIADISNRKGNGSNTFHVPKNQQNISKLEHINKVGSLSTLQYTKPSVRYRQDGIQIIKSGYAIISEVGEDFEVTIYDGNIPFFDLLDKAKLSDLDFSSLDHVWDNTNAFNYRTNTANIIYPIVDYGNAPLSFVFGTNTFRVNFALPWIFLHTVWEKIFSTIGYTFSGKFTSSTLFANLIISLPTLHEAEHYLLAKAASTADSAFIPITGAVVLFDNQISDPIDAFAPPGLLVVTTETKYVAYVKGTYSFKFIIIWETGAPSPGGFIEIISTGTPVLAHIELAGSGATGTETIIVNDVPMEQGDVCFALVRGNIASGSVKVKAGSSMECIAADGKISYGKMFSVSDNLPAITQKDLIKAIMQQYCIIPITNTLTKNVQFVQFGEIIANKAIAPDWTSKVDMSVQSKLSFRSTYAQTNWLRYREDSTIVDTVGDAETIGDGSFAVADTVLPTEKDVFTLPFSPSPMVTRFTGLDVPLYAIYNVTSSEWNEGQPRILILAKQNVTPAFGYNDDTTGISTDGLNENLAYFILPGKADNLGFGNNLISKHYSEFVDMLNSYKKVTVAMKLSAVDIEALDFSIPVYLNISDLQGYYFINRINQWTDFANSCDVELVKID